MLSGKDGTICNVCKRTIAVKGFDGWFVKAWVGNRAPKLSTICAQSENSDGDKSCYKIGYESLNEK